LQEKREHDAILLGFGHGFLCHSEKIVSAAKQLRKEINAVNGVDFPAIHIVDHDYDSERNNVRLRENEFIIKVYGEEKVRCQCDDLQPDQMIDALKRVILENITQFSA
jgi:hypothetical protein